MIYDLLKMTQMILSSMDSDEVNDINDTVESQQVVDIIEQTYNDISSTIEFPDMWDLFELEPSNDITRPTVMYLPADVAKVEWIQYDCKKGASTVREFHHVFPVRRVQFFDKMNGLDSADTDVYQYDYLVGSETFDVRGKNNQNPGSYTTVDNRTLIFDNYDASEGQTLISTRTKCYGMKIPQFSRLNGFVPQFDPRQFTLFFNEAKAQCFIELKSVQNAKAEQRARRGWVHSQKKKPDIPLSEVREWKPNYGRR